ncbi:hypothetical protein EI555_004432, partial [Monodon monoceros]
PTPLFPAAEGRRSEQAAALTWDASPAQLRRGVWGHARGGGGAQAGDRGAGPASPRDSELAALRLSPSRWPLPALGSFLAARVGRRLHHRDITSIEELIGRPRRSRTAGLEQPDTTWHFERTQVPRWPLKKQEARGQGAGRLCPSSASPATSLDHPKPSKDTVSAPTPSPGI